jgi:DNA (cytosine-5)-methyltransferase 1
MKGNGAFVCCCLELAIDEKKYYFSKKAVEGMKNAKNNMKRGLAQNLDEPCLTITSHLAKVSLNSRDPVLLVDPGNELYRRFTPREQPEFSLSPMNLFLQVRKLMHIAK